KEELIQTLKEMDDRIQFDIITFETEVERWKGELVPASASNKEAAIAFIKRQKPRGADVVTVRRGKASSGSGEGRTNLGGAREMAVGIASGGSGGAAPGAAGAG